MSPAPASRFTYPRSVVRDVARTLRDLRATIDITSLDQVIRALGDTFAEHTTPVEVEQFLDWSWYRRDTDPTGSTSQGETSTWTTTSPSAGT